MNKDLYYEIYQYLKPHIIKLHNLEIIKSIFNDSPEDNNVLNNDLRIYPIYSILKDILFLNYKKCFS